MSWVAVGLAIIGLRRAAGAGINAWTPTGPCGGDIEAPAGAPSDPTVVYASVSGALFRSTNAGATWSPVAIAPGPYYAPITAIAIDPRTPSTLYVGGGSAFGEGSFGLVVRTSDAGRTWVSTWSDPYPIVALAIDPDVPTTRYAAGGGVFRSTDRATTWHRANTGLNAGVSALAIDPTTPTTLYAAATGSLVGGGGVFRSSNGGATWSPAGDGLPTNWVVSALVVDPLTPTTLYAATPDGGVFKSTDGAGSWSAIDDGLSNPAVRALAIDPAQPTTVYAGTFGGGMYRSTDGGASWMAINNGLTDSYIRTLAIDPSRPLTVYVGTESALFRSTDGGANWTAIDLAGYYAGALAVDTADTLRATSRLSGVARSIDGGDTWRALATGLGAPEAGYLEVSSFALDPGPPSKLFAVTGSGVFVINQFPACAGDCNGDDDVHRGAGQAGEHRSRRHLRRRLRQRRRQRRRAHHHRRDHPGRQRRPRRLHDRGRTAVNRPRSAPHRRDRRLAP